MHGHSIYQHCIIMQQRRLPPRLRCGDGECRARNKYQMENVEVTKTNTHYSRCFTWLLGAAIAGTQGMDGGAVCKGMWSPSLLPSQLRSCNAAECEILGRTGDPRARP